MAVNGSTFCADGIFGEPQVATPLGIILCAGKNVEQIEFLELA
jgi:hypothetical protein